MNPHIINIIAKGHKEKISELDYFAWLFNQYTLSAVSVAIEHNFAGRKAKSKYIEKPLHELAEEKEYEEKNDRKEYQGMTEEEKQDAEWERAKSYFNSLIARF